MSTATGPLRAVPAAGRGGMRGALRMPALLSRRAGRRREESAQAPLSAPPAAAPPLPVPLRTDSPFEAIGQALKDNGGMFCGRAVLVTPKERDPLGEPYREIAAGQLAAYRAANGLAPRLTFTAARPDATAPIKGLAALRDAEAGAALAAAGAPEIAPVCAAAASTDLASVRQAARAVRGIDFSAVDEARKAEGLTHAGVLEERAAQSAPLPGGAREWLRVTPRPRTFAADKKALPLFAGTARQVGWTGLHMPRRDYDLPRWSTEGWARREQALADSALRQARLQVLGGPHPADLFGITYGEGR